MRRIVFSYQSDSCPPNVLYPNFLLDLTEIISDGLKLPRVELHEIR